mgnify:CR=1 FL=1
MLKPLSLNLWILVAYGCKGPTKSWIESGIPVIGSYRTEYDPKEGVPIRYGKIKKARFPFVSVTIVYSVYVLDIAVFYE